MKPKPALLVLAFWPAAALAQPAAIAPIARCAASLAERDQFAGSVAVARNGELLWSGAFGAAGPGRERTTAETPHNVGSINKMFTAVAIGQLVDSGRLALDDPVGRHLPDLPPEIGRITITQLLSHRSGLGDFFRIENREAIRAARTARDLLGVAIASGLQFEPGTRRAYSNAGFIVLGAVVEQLSGQAYSDYVREHVFVPAGMFHTTMAAPADAATPMTRLALQPGAAAPEARRPAPVIGGGRASAAGGAYSTATDLVRFAAALVANRLTRPATTAALLGMIGTPGAANPRSGESRGYGLAFNLWQVNGVRFAGHGGGTPGVNGELSINLADGTAVAALSHYDPPSAEQVTAFARQALAHPGSGVDQALCGTLAVAPPGMGPRRIQAGTPETSARRPRN